MTATYSVIADPAHDLIRITLAGFFDDASMAGFAAARVAAHAMLRCGPNRHLTLADTRAIAIQSQEFVARWGAVLADPLYRSRKLAFVTASSLARMQLQRAIGGRDSVACFMDMAQAEAWLLAATASAAA
jgi:hypothetical protein